MSTDAIPLDEIGRLGLEALERELGPVGMIRFLQQFETGRGDYSRERDEWFRGFSVTGVVREIRASRQGPADATQ